MCTMLHPQISFYRFSVFTSSRMRPTCRAAPARPLHRWHLQAVQRADQWPRQQQQRQQQPRQWQQQQQWQQQLPSDESREDEEESWQYEASYYQPPPARRYSQLYKAKRPRQSGRLLDAPQDPRDPLWGTTKRERKAALQQQLQQQYGPQAGDRDIRLYLKKRALNEARLRGTRRGGLPLDDSFDKPGTFLKLGLDFQRTVLLERVDQLVATLPQLSPESAWQLYTTAPGLLTSPTMVVAQRLTGLAQATGLSIQATVEYCCTFRPLAFVVPDTVMSRVALLAKVARLSKASAVVLMQQQPALWLISSALLAPRVEQLSLLLHCCPVTSLRLIGSCPGLLAVPLSTVLQHVSALCSVMGVPGQPERVVPLLLAQPELLLGPERSPVTSSGVSEQRQQQEGDHLAAAAAAVGAAPRPVTGGAEQQQQQGEGAAAAVGAAPRPLTAVSTIGHQLHVLSAALSLPPAMVQGLAVGVPDLLQLAAAGPDAVAAAVARLSRSWLMEPDVAVQQRQQYQQELVQLLQPSRYSNVAKKRKVRQVQESAAAGWYEAAQAVDACVLSCQWWSDAQQQQQLPPLQQLVHQAPALLALVAAEGVQMGHPEGQQHAATAEGQAARQSWRPPDEKVAVDTWGLAARLHSLCYQLQQLVDKKQQAQHQHQQPFDIGPAQTKAQSSTQHQPGSQELHIRQQPNQKMPRQLQHQQQHQPQQQQQQQADKELSASVCQAAVLEPCILTQPPGWVVNQLQQLSAALQIPTQRMLSLWLHHPSILWLTQGQVFEQVRVLCGVLRLPAQQLKELVAQPDAVLLLLVKPEALKKGFRTAAKAAGGDGALRSVLRQHPAALLPGKQGELYRLTVRNKR